MNFNYQLKDLILQKFKSKAACAKAIGWDRCRLNRIVSFTKEPNVFEVNELSRILDVSIEILVGIFLKL